MPLGFPNDPGRCAPQREARRADNGLPGNVSRSHQLVGRPNHSSDPRHDRPRPAKTFPEGGVNGEFAVFGVGAKRRKLQADLIDQRSEMRIGRDTDVMPAGAKCQPDAYERMDIAVAAEGQEEDVRKVVSAHEFRAGWVDLRSDRYAGARRSFLSE